MVWLPSFNDEIAVCAFIEEAEYGAIASLIIKYDKVCEWRVGLSLGYWFTYFWTL